MNYLYIIFGIGMIAEVLMLVGSKIDMAKLFKALKWALFAALILTISSDFQLMREAQIEFINAFLFTYLLLLPLFIFIFFAQEILSKISTVAILSYSVLFWFIYLSNFYPENIYSYVATAAFLLITAYVFYLIFFIRQYNYSELITMISWFFVLAISMGIFQYFSAPRNIENSIGVKSFYNAFLSGMVLMYAAINAWCLFAFSFKNKPVKYIGPNDIESLKEKYIDTDINLKFAVIVIIFQSIIFILNYYYKYVSDNFLIGVWFVLIPLLFSKHFKLKNKEVAGTF